MAEIMHVDHKVLNKKYAREFHDICNDLLKNKFDEVDESQNVLLDLVESIKVCAKYEQTVGIEI